MTSRPVGETIVKAFDRNGFCVLPDVLDAACRRGLQDILAQSDAAQARRGSTVYGARNLLADRSIRDLAESPAVRMIVDILAGPSARVVRQRPIGMCRGIKISFLPLANESKWPVGGRGR